MTRDLLPSRLARWIAVACGFGREGSGLMPGSGRARRAGLIGSPRFFLGLNCFPGFFLPVGFFAHLGTLNPNQEVSRPLKTVCPPW